MENLLSTLYSTARMRLIALFVLALALGEFPAFAQAQPDTGEPVTMKMLSSSPQPGERGVQATIGGSQQSGSSNSQGLSIELAAAHTTKSGDLVRFDADYSLARYKQVETAPWFKVQDDMVVQNVYLHLFEKRWAAMGAAYYRRDPIVGLDHRAFAQGGLGYQFANSPKFKLLAGGSFAFGQQSRQEFGSQAVRAIGFTDSLVLRLGRTTSLEQSILYHIDVSNTDDKTYTLSASLLSQISKHAGLKISFNRQYDSLVPKGVPGLQSAITVGLTVGFQPSHVHAAAPKP
jgi:putative salt-induced outer membrane protein YdiY